MQGAVAKRLCNGLQIRLARFDSGPRLQYTRITDSSVVRFFSSAHRSTRAAHFFRGPAFAAGCSESCPVVQDRVARVEL